jgi:hypothetical protein
MGAGVPEASVGAIDSSTYPGHGSSGHGAIRSLGVAVLGARPVVIAGIWLRWGPVMAGASSWRVRGCGGPMGVVGPVAMAASWL